MLSHSKNTENSSEFHQFHLPASLICVLPHAATKTFNYQTEFHSTWEIHLCYLLYDMKSFCRETSYHTTNSYLKLLTISIASGVVPRVMGSRSFCFDLSGDCKCASWLAARTREAGCCTFIPEDCWASGSSKLDLEKDCVRAFRVERKVHTIMLLVTTKQVLFITFMCIYFYILTLFQLNFISLYLITLCNIFSKQCTEASSIRNGMHIP